MNLEDAAAKLSELSGKPLRPFATRDFGRDRNPAARSVLVKSSEANSLVAKIRSQLGPGLVAFVGCTRSLSDPPDQGSEVVVAEGESQFDILRVAQSDAVNYGLDTEDLIGRLEAYHITAPIDIFHAETDTIEFRLIALPDNLDAFCDDLYEFCPDIVEQGSGSVDKLKSEIVRTGVVYLWWD